MRVSNVGERPFVSVQKVQKDEGIRLLQILKKSPGNSLGQPWIIPLLQWIHTPE
jgi:hypothetical protein